MRTTRKSEIPSTPRCQEMPQSLIQACFETNWNPASPEENLMSIHTLIAPVAMLDTSAVSLIHSGRREDSSATPTDPSSGTRMSIVKMGNPTVDVAADEAIMRDLDTRTMRARRQLRWQRSRHTHERIPTASCGRSRRFDVRAFPYRSLPRQRSWRQPRRPR